MRGFRKKKAQSIIEYAVAFVVVAVGITAIGFISNAKGVFQGHFDDAMQEMGMAESFNDEFVPTAPHPDPIPDHHIPDPTDGRPKYLIR